MKWKIFFLSIFILTLISLPSISAQPPQIGEAQNLTLQISYPKFQSIEVNKPFNLSVHVYYPNLSIVLDANCDLEIYNHTGQHIVDTPLTLIGDEYSYLLTGGNFSQIDVYQYEIYCYSPDSEYGEFVSGEFWVTPSGELFNTGTSNILILSVGFFIILGILSFLGFYKSTGNIGIAMPVKWTFFIFGFIFFLTSINLISLVIQGLAIQDSVVDFFGSFTAISFYLFWFAFGVLGVLWFLTALQTLLLRKNQRKMSQMEGIR